MCTTALTDQQRKLVEDNHNLIYKFATSKNASVEEFYGLFAIGLCKAAMIFDESKGLTFSTLAYKCMDNEYGMYWRAALCGKRINPNLIFSSEELIGDIGTDGYVFDKTRIYVEEFFNRLPKNQKRVLNGLLHGYKGTEIAEHMGCTSQRVSAIKKQIGKQWIMFAGGR